MTAPALSPSLLGLLRPISLHFEGKADPLAVLILQPAPQPFDEQIIRYRLADHAVRVWAAASLEREGRALDAATLRALPAIADANSAAVAATAVRQAHGLEAAALAAEGSTITPAQPEDTGFVGEQAAYVVMALADRFSAPNDKQRVYAEALQLVTTLRAGHR